MKNIAELENLDEVVNKMIKIAAHVLENTAFKYVTFPFSLSQNEVVRSVYLDEVYVLCCFHIGVL